MNPLKQSRHELSNAGISGEPQPGNIILIELDA